MMQTMVSEEEAMNLFKWDAQLLRSNRFQPNQFNFIFLWYNRIATVMKNRNAITDNKNAITHLSSQQERRQHCIGYKILI